MLSQKARYALHALIALARHGDREPMLTADIAEEADVPKKFLEQILLELKKRGIVNSLRGRQGGYLLGRPADEISFADVIRITDGPLALAQCASVTAHRRCDGCVDEKTCALHKTLVKARDATAAVLESSTIAAAAANPRKR